MAQFVADGITDEQNGNEYNFADREIRDKIDDGFMTDDGIGGLRVDENTLQVQVIVGYDAQHNPIWGDVAGGTSIKLGDVSGAIAVARRKTVQLKWSDPADVIVSGSLLAEWAGTKVVRKSGSAPTSINDGTVVVDSKVRDAYASTAFIDNDENLIYGTTYYYKFFPYTTENKVTVGSSVSATPVASRNMGIRLDFSNTNPTTWATYLGDAVGMEAGSEDWDEFFGEYPCMLLNGVEGAELNPTNLALHADGTNADITSGTEGDVMTKYAKRLGWKVTKSGSIVDIYLTDEDETTADGYSFKAFYYKGKKCSAFYRGCFKGYESSSKLWSLSGKTITANKTIGAFRTLAQAKGTGYEQSGYYQMTLLQIMYLLKYKGANSQDKANGGIGRGYVDSNSAAVQTGGTVGKGRDWGETTGKYQMCFQNQEDFFGNIWEWLDGLVTDGSRNYLVCDPTTNTAFNDSGSGYVNVGGGWGSNQSGYVSSVIGTNDAPLTANGFGGSETTLLCDNADANASCVALFGGTWTAASSAGAFHVYVTTAASNSYAYIGARLMFFEVDQAA